MPVATGTTVRVHRTTFRAGLTPGVVVAAALELLDRDGLEAFSMRSLARELGVQPGALYRHVPDREALLADVVGLILSDVVLPEATDDWEAALSRFASTYRAALHRHAGAAPLVSGQLVSNGPQDFPIVESLLSCLTGGGFTKEALLQAYNTFLGWLVGFVGVELAPAPPESTGWVARRRADLRAVRASDYPLIAAHRKELEQCFAVRWRSGAEAPMDDAFTAALKAILAGLPSLRR